MCCTNMLPDVLYQHVTRCNVPTCYQMYCTNMLPDVVYQHVTRCSVTRCTAPTCYQMYQHVTRCSVPTCYQMFWTSMLPDVVYQRVTRCWGSSETDWPSASIPQLLCALTSSSYHAHPSPHLPKSPRNR